MDRGRTACELGLVRRGGNESDDGAVARRRAVAGHRPPRASSASVGTGAPLGARRARTRPARVGAAAFLVEPDVHHRHLLGRPDPGRLAAARACARIGGRLDHPARSADHGRGRDGGQSIDRRPRAVVGHPRLRHHARHPRGLGVPPRPDPRGSLRWTGPLARTADASDADHRRHDDRSGRRSGDRRRPAARLGSPATLAAVERGRRRWGHTPESSRLLGPAGCRRHPDARRGHRAAGPLRPRHVLAWPHLRRLRRPILDRHRPDPGLHHRCRHPQPPAGNVPDRFGTSDPDVHRRARRTRRLPGGRSHGGAAFRRVRRHVGARRQLDPTDVAAQCRRPVDGRERDHGCGCRTAASIRSRQPTDSGHDRPAVRP